MTSTLLISTYNSPRFLDICLSTVMRQTVVPTEIVIADDGSTDDTRQLIDSYRPRLRSKLLHVWQEDHGFRLAQIRNKAIAASSGDYIIQIDGDLILDAHFVEDHLHYASKGCFSAGGRCLLSQQATNHIETTGDTAIGMFSEGVENRFNALRIRPLAPLLFGETHCRGCNMAFWRDDLMAVNGYDERMEGCGLEDTDIMERLMRHGVKRRHLKLCAVAFHLWHGGNKPSATNDDILEDNRQRRAIRAEKGITDHFSDKL